MQQFSKLPRLLLGILAVAILFAENVEQSFSLRLEINPSTVTLGSRIPGKLILTNISNHDIQVYVDKSHDAHPSGFFVELRDSHGNALERTASGAVVFGSGWSEAVKPEATVEYKVDPSYQFKIREPGTYSVQVKQLDGKRNTLVESNIVEITITK